MIILSIIAGGFGAYVYNKYIFAHPPMIHPNDSNNDYNDYNDNNGQKNNANHANNHAQINDNLQDTLIFEDNFDNLDLDRWEHVITMQGGGNWEFEYYTNNRSNSYIKDGVLYVKPTLTNNTYTAPDFLSSGTIDLWGSSPADQCTSENDYGCFRTGTASNVLNPVQSARLRTVDSFSFQYGKVEISAQLPKGDWLWPAIWMLPAKNSYGQWPASGEVDIIEARGNYYLDCSGQTSTDGDSIGINGMGTSLHWGPYYGADMYNMTHTTEKLSSNELFSDSFHTWTMEWSSTGFSFYLDDATTPYMVVNSTEFDGYWKHGAFDTKFPNSFNPWERGLGNNTQNATDAPFNQEFYLVIDLAVGGTSGFFPDGCVSKPDNNIPSYTKPWTDDSSTSSTEFWSAVDNWYPTWEPFTDDGENAALKIDYIRVYNMTS